jgi:hypothetical protein
MLAVRREVGGPYMRPGIKYLFYCKRQKLVNGNLEVLTGDQSVSFEGDLDISPVKKYKGSNFRANLERLGSLL